MRADRRAARLNVSTVTAVALRLTESFRTSNSCKGTPADFATRLKRKVVCALLVYRWLALVLMTTPPFSRGAWSFSYLFS